MHPFDLLETLYMQMISISCDGYGVKKAQQLINYN